MKHFSRISFVFLIAFLLVFAMGIHTFNFDHFHPGYDHQGEPGLVMHGQDKKIFIFVLLFAYTAFLMPTLLKIKFFGSARDVMKMYRLHTGLVEKVHDYLLALFQNGILHSKIYDASLAL